MTSLCPDLPNFRCPVTAKRVRGATGFTLIELLITLTVAGILATLAAPAFTSLIASQRTKSVASNLHLSLALARSEASKRNANVTISANLGGWVNGWTIFPNATPANILHNYDATRGVAIAATNSSNVATASVVFQSSGRVQGTIKFVVSAAAGGSTANRCVSVDLSGRPYVKDGTTC